MRRAVWALLAAVTVAGVLLLFVFPARTFLAQRRALASTSERIAVLAKENAALSAKVARLKTPSEVAKIARERYGLVRPGEKAYALLPPAAQATTKPAEAGGNRVGGGSSAAASSRSGATSGAPTATAVGQASHRSRARPSRFWRRLEFWR